MYLNFSNFRGQTSAGGGQALVQKRGQVSDGGIGKIFAGWGGPPRKKTLIGWPKLHKIFSFWQKGVNYFWESVDAILEEVPVTKTNVWC